MTSQSRDFYDLKGLHSGRIKHYRYNLSNGLLVKRIIIFSVITSFFLSSCIGNASLWGQYQTPTPIGSIPQYSISSSTRLFVAETPVVVDGTPIPSPLPATPTPTSLLNTFVTQDVTSLVNVESTPTIDGDTILYYAQSGDWLPAVANRFGVSASEITSPKILSENGFLDPGTLLIIPDRLDKTVQYTSNFRSFLIVNCVFSATSVDFNVEQYVKDAGGYLSTYREYLGTTAWTTGAQEIERLAIRELDQPAASAGAS